MENTGSDVFISYNWTHKEDVLQIFNGLKNAGMSCWMDETEMGPGDDLPNEIAEGVKNCKVFISCISHHYRASEICRKEVKLANDYKKTIISVYLDDVDKPEGSGLGLIFSRLIYVDFSDSLEELRRWQGPKVAQLVHGVFQNISKSDKESSIRKHLSGLINYSTFENACRLKDEVISYNLPINITIVIAIVMTIAGYQYIFNTNQVTIGLQKESIQSLTNSITEKLKLKQEIGDLKTLMSEIVQNSKNESEEKTKRLVEENKRLNDEIKRMIKRTEELEMNIFQCQNEKSRISDKKNLQTVTDDAWYSFPATVSKEYATNVLNGLKKSKEEIKEQFKLMNNERKKINEDFGDTLKQLKDVLRNELEKSKEEKKENTKLEENKRPNNIWDLKMQLKEIFVKEVNGLREENRKQSQLVKNENNELKDRFENLKLLLKEAFLESKRSSEEKKESWKVAEEHRKNLKEDMGDMKMSLKESFLKLEKSNEKNKENVETVKNETKTLKDNHTDRPKSFTQQAVPSEFHISIPLTDISCAYMVLMLFAVLFGIFPNWGSHQEKFAHIAENVLLFSFALASFFIYLKVVIPAIIFGCNLIVGSVITFTLFVLVIGISSFIFLKWK